MKVHTDLKELLEDFYNHILNNVTMTQELPEVAVRDYLTSNSLALGKPEPLAKNKQFKKSCYHWDKEKAFTRTRPSGAWYCNDCNKWL